MQKGLLGCDTLLLHTLTNSSELWDKALSYNSNSSHESPLCCSESIKGSYNPLLRPEASFMLWPGEMHSVVLNLLAKLFLLGAWLWCKGQGTGKTPLKGQGMARWELGWLHALAQHHLLPRGSCQSAAALQAPRLLLLHIHLFQAHMQLPHYPPPSHSLNISD